jgi:metal-responsive CopG/Arc/MetJ family transcriptional regulator
MATVNFSVPDDVKAAFDRVFKGKNKSAVIADFMRRAVDETKQQKRRAGIFRLLTQRRSQRAPASDAEIHAARAAGRP